MKDWEFDCEFTAGNLVARVSKLDLYAPRYSIQLGFMRNDHTITPFLPYTFVEMYDDNSDLVRSVDNAENVAKIYKQAEDYVKGKLQERADLLKKEAADKAALEAERAAKIAAKKKQYEANFEKRRNDNRQRTAQTKGKKG